MMITDRRFTIESVNMERERTIKIGPVCRFGPGGEYTSMWPEDLVEVAEFAACGNKSKNARGGLLNVLKGIIEILRGSQPGREFEIEEPAQVDEGTSSGVIQPYGTTDNPAAYAQAGSVVEGDSAIRQQRWLFADDWRTGQPGGRKQDNHVRTHRAITKKGIHFGPGAQSTLFDADVKGAKTA